MHRFKMDKIVHCVLECGHAKRMKNDLSTAPLGREADTCIYLSNDMHVCELPQTTQSCLFVMSQILQTGFECVL